MVPIQTYKKFLTDLIRRHMIIFGTNIAQEIAASVPGLSVSDTGEVIGINGAPLVAVKKLIAQYQELSEPVALSQFRLLFDKYPDIYLEYNEPIPSIRLSCALIERQK